MGGNAILTTNIDGRMLFVDADDVTLTPQILTRRTYEPGTSRLFCRIVRPGARVLDIGANIGWYALLAAERVGKTGRVLAFEPQTRMFELLHRAVFANGFWDRTTLFPVALGPERGTADLEVVPGKFGFGTLRHWTQSALAWQGASEAETTPVQVHTLDDILAEDLRVDVIKIDVEGFEREVFDGAQNVFRASKQLKMIMEFTPKVHGEEMLDYLRSMGFVLHRITRTGSLRKLTVDLSSQSDEVMNVFAVRT